jgi:signal transduction histidine kinase
MMPLDSLWLAALAFWRNDGLRRLEQLIEALYAMRVGQDVSQVLSETLEQVRGILEARSVLLLYYDGQEEQVYRWTSEPQSGDNIGEVPPAENPVWMDFTTSTAPERIAEDGPLARRLGAHHLLAVSCAARGNYARLLAVDPKEDPGESANTALRRIGELLFDLAERVFLLRRVHIRAIDQERDRIAQDFHDGPLQTFFSFDVHLQYIRQILHSDPARAAQELQNLQDLARDQGRELRELIMEMRPVDLEGATLASVLRLAVEGSQKSGGLAVHLLAGEPRLHVPRKICRQTYQILREALNNARKHARAQHVVVTLSEGPDYFELTIDDDGAGFKFSGSHSLEELDEMRLGPVSIKQRARQMGARLTVESTPGRGSKLVLRVPVPPPLPPPKPE